MEGVVVPAITVLVDDVGFFKLQWSVSYVQQSSTKRNTP